MKAKNSDLVADSFWEAWRQPIVTEVKGPMEANPGANFLPTADNSWDNPSLRADFRMSNGLSVARSFRKPDVRISEEFALQERKDPLYLTTQKGSEWKAAPLDRRQQEEYAMRNLKTYDNTYIPPGEMIRMERPQEIPRNRPSHVYQYNEYKRGPAPSRLTKQLPIEADDIPRITASNLSLGYDEANDPRNQLIFQRKGNFDVREMVIAPEIPNGLSNAFGASGVNSYAGSVSHYRIPMGRIPENRIEVAVPPPAPEQVASEWDHRQELYTNPDGIAREIEQSKKWYTE